MDASEERLRIGQRVRHLYPQIGPGTVVEDTGDPEDRGAYLVRYDNGEEFLTSRTVLEVIADDATDGRRG